MEWLTSLALPLVAGGLAGAIYTSIQASLRNKTTAARVTAALRADLGRVQEISAHNKRTAVTLQQQDRPRAFILFPTQSYELLLFGGQIASLTGPEALDSVLAYLQQAEHANAMIRLFEQIEVQGAGLPGAPLAGKKNAYLGAIHEYCEVTMPGTLARLDRALDTKLKMRKQ